MNLIESRMMRRALSLARRWAGRCWPNPSVGACLLGDDGWVCEGVHEGPGSRHAEAAALDRALAEGRDLERSTLFVTLEPCNHTGRTGPCSDAILAAGVPRVIYASGDPNPGVDGGGAAALAAAGIEISKAGPSCERLAIELNHAYFEAGFGERPHVTLKLAMDLEGRLARESGRVEDPALRAISGERAHRRAHQLRSASGCVLIGRGTVFADHPRLDIRRVPATHRPRPVVLDTRLRSEAQALPRESLILHGDAPEAAAEALAQAGHECVRLDGGPDSWPAVLSELSGRGLGIVLVEGGAAVAESLLAAGLADRLHLFHAPEPIGGHGARLESLGAEALGGLPLAAGARVPVAGALWTVLRSRRLGADYETILRR